METPIRAAYILHSPTLANRSQHVKHLESMLGSVCCTVNRVTENEASEVLPLVSSLVDLDPSKVDDASMRPFVKNMQIRQLSNAMKHARALQLIANDAVDDVAASQAFRIVLEDDSMFGDQASQILRDVCSNAPDDADLIFLSLPSPRQRPAQGIAFDNVFNVFNILPACDAYLIRPKAAKRLRAAFMPVRMATTPHLTHLIKTLGIYSYISVPNAFVDGSKLGAFACSVDANSKLLWNQHYCKMDVLLKSSADYNAAVQSQFDQLLNEQHFGTHPDVLALVAKHHERSGRFKEAQEAYARAIAAYDSNGCIINNTSEVFRNYLALFGRLQDDVPDFN